MAAYVPYPFHGNPKAYLWSELNRIAVAISGGGITNLSPASAAVVLTPNPILGAGTIGVSANLNLYSAGDTPSAFTLTIVDSVDAAAWRAAIGAGTSSVVIAAPDRGVQFNNAGVLGASANFTYSANGNLALAAASASNTLTLNQGVTAAGFVLQGSNNFATFGIISNPNAGAAALSLMDMSNGATILNMGMTGTGYSGAYLSGGPTGEIGVVSTDKAKPVVIGTNLTARVSIDGTTGEATFYYNVLGLGHVKATGILPVTTAQSYTAIGNLSASTYPAVSQFAVGGPANNRRWLSYLDETSGGYNVALASDAGSVTAVGLSFTGVAGAINAATIQATTINFSGAVAGGAATWTGTQTLTKSATSSLTGALLLSSAVPVIALNETGAAANNRLWDIVPNGSVFYVRVIDDATTIARTALAFTRSGTALSAMAYGNSTDLPAHSFFGPVLTTASTTSVTGLRVPHGAAPSSPVNGDMWTTTAGLFVRINGATVGPLT